jgi:hypothetical protein
MNELEAIKEIKKRNKGTRVMAPTVHKSEGFKNKEIADYLCVSL